MTAGAAHRSGAVVLAGRPNVGKSTLLNALVGQKISIVTHKAQTTRHRIRGILTRPAYQLVLLDTPGAGKPGGSRLGHAMNREAAAGVAGADVVLFMTAAPQYLPADAAVLAGLRTSGLPIVVAINKVDRVHPRDRLLPLLERVAGEHDFAAVVPVSASRGDNLERLLEVLVPLLPEASAPYPAGQVTDRSERFLAAEVLRGQLMLGLSDELPYGLAVEIERFEDLPDGRTEIDAVVWVERVGQRKIVIGAGGARLKAIGTAARMALNELLGRRVHLQTWVRVREGWTEDDRMLNRLGHDPS
ncbi:MAG: GTPase Era [Steroidobacteraceae bacterium]